MTRTCFGLMNHMCVFLYPYLYMCGCMLLQGRALQPTLLPCGLVFVLPPKGAHAVVFS